MGAHADAAVSYTHLDVYKRQPYIYEREEKVMSLEVTINVPGLKELSQALMQLAVAMGGKSVQMDEAAVEMCIRDRRKGCWYQVPLVAVPNLYELLLTAFYFLCILLKYPPHFHMRV